MQDVRGFMGIGGHKKGYLVKIVVSFRCNGRGVQQKDFGRYLSIYSEIRGIL
jgi:hypothetical protein